MKPLRVLHVIPSVSSADGGPTKAVAAMERALSEAGLLVTTLTTDHDRPAEVPLSSGCPAGSNGVRRLYTRKWTNAYKVSPGLAFELLKSVRSYDVVHIHALFSFAPTIAAWAARLFGVPYIVRPLGTLSQYGMTVRRRRLKWISVALIERHVLREAAAVHFTSQAELEEARKLGLPFRGVVVPLGVEPIAHCADGGLKQEHPALVGRKVVLFLSRLDPKKNLETLIDAIAQSDMLKQSCALLIAGSGEASYVEGLKVRAVRAGVADHIVWLGHVEGGRKAAAFAAADVYALPSFSENFGVAAVEALFAGLPCVLGQGVAIAGEVERGRAGIAVAPEARTIRRALEQLLGDANLRQSMSIQARALAEREYSARTMAQRLIALYEDVCTTRRIKAA
jgi:glycosyltransferase involved in cell wall biosynthesis